MGRKCPSLHYTTTTSSLNHWYNAGWIHMDPSCVRQGSSSQVPGVVFCCSGPPSSQFECCAFRDAHLHTCKSHCLLISWKQSDKILILLWSNASSNHFHSENCCSLDVFFSFFGPFFLNPRDGCAWKSQYQQIRYSDTQISRSGTSSHVTFKSHECHLFRVYVPKCVEFLLCDFAD